MLRNPDAGWVDFKIGDFESCLSIVGGHVALDFLQAFINRCENKQPLMLCGDEETVYVVFIEVPWFGFYGIRHVHDNLPPKAIYLEDVCLVSLANELIADVERDIYEWSTWMSGDYQKRYEDINIAIARLKKLLHESPPQTLLKWPENGDSSC